MGLWKGGEGHNHREGRRKHNPTVDIVMTRMYAYRNEYVQAVLNVLGRFRKATNSLCAVHQRTVALKTQQQEVEVYGRDLDSSIMTISSSGSWRKGNNGQLMITKERDRRYSLSVEVWSAWSSLTPSGGESNARLCLHAAHPLGEPWI